MIYEIPLVIIPALIALLIKLFLAYISRDGNHYSKLFFTMVLILAGHNLAEILGTLEFSSGDRYDLVIRWYYLISILALVSILAYSYEISALSRPASFLVITYCCLVVALVLLTLHSNLIVAGAAPLGHTLTAIRGTHHWIFIVFSIFNYTLSIALLCRGYIQSKDNLTQIRCCYTIAAILPIILTALTMLVVIPLGYSFNAVGIMPLATTAFLLITLAGERTHEITDIRRHIPFSLERQTSKKIMDIFSEYTNDNLKYRESLNEIERLLITHKHDKKGNIVSHTAQAMDVPRSSLYSIVKRLGIELKDHKES